MRKILFAMLLACISSNAAARWILAGNNSVTTVYYDPATMLKTADKTVMWSLYNLHEAAKDAAGIYLSLKVHAEYDCKENSVRVVETTYHPKNMGEGKAIEVDSVPAEWTPVAPGSVAEDLWKFACGSSPTLLKREQNL